MRDECGVPQLVRCSQACLVALRGTGVVTGVVVHPAAKMAEAPVGGDEAVAQGGRQRVALEQAGYQVALGVGHVDQCRRAVGLVQSPGRGRSASPDW